jgi:hypothetical protein
VEVAALKGNWDGGGDAEAAVAGVCSGTVVSGKDGRVGRAVAASAFRVAGAPLGAGTGTAPSMVLGVAGAPLGRDSCNNKCAMGDVVASSI